MSGNGNDKEYQNRYNRASTFSTNLSNTSGRQSIAPTGPLQRRDKANGSKGKADNDGWQVVHGKKR